MSCPRLLTALILFCLPGYAGSLQLNSFALDTSRFRVTEFAVLGLPISMLPLADGSLAVGGYADGIVRFADFNHDGIADGPATTIYAAPGARLGLIQAGAYLIDSNFGTYFSGNNTPSITVLKPGATPDAPLTPVGSLQFGFPPDWEHNQPGIAARPTPGQPGSFDLVFNVGSEYDHVRSSHTVQLSGLLAGTVEGDSLYMVTLNLSGSQPTASGLRKVAGGIRNVVGMGFQPGTGDFYFLDNAIDGPGPDGDEPPQAEEINRIVSADFGNGTPPDFGYPICYVEYRTGAHIGSGCIQPFFAIQPLANGTLLGSESEGVTQFDFAPANFPVGFNNGIFIGFSGKGGTGAANEENAVGYYDFNSGNYIHFSENSQDGVYNPIGIRSSVDALYIADYGAGVVYQVTATSPEPGSLVLGTAGMTVLLLLSRKKDRPSPPTV
jgi:hypothetical protein